MSHIMLRNTHKGGSPFPLRYFDAGYPITTAGSGSDVLGVSGNVIRPKIGGYKCTRQRSTHKRSTRQRSTRYKHKCKQSKRGGFTPTIMEPFVTAAGKYIVPMALYSGYKLMTRGKTVKKSKGKKSKSRK